MAVGLGHNQADVTLILSQRPARVCSLDSWRSCLWHPALLETVCSSLWAPPSKLLIISQYPPSNVHSLQVRPQHSSQAHRETVGTPPLTFARQAVHQAQEAQQADFIARVSEVGPGCIDVAGGATLLPTDVCLQHQAAGGLSALLEPAYTTYAEMEEEGDSRPHLYL